MDTHEYKQIEQKAAKDLKHMAKNQKCRFTPHFSAVNVRRKVLVYADASIFLNSLRKRIRRLHFGRF